MFLRCRFGWTMISQSQGTHLIRASNDAVLESVTLDQDSRLLSDKNLGPSIV